MNLEYLLKSILNYNVYLLEKKQLLIVKMIYILQNLILMLLVENLYHFTVCSVPL